MTIPRTERATAFAVDPNGADSFRTIAEALGAARGAWGLPVEIRIAPGTYREKLAVSQPFVTLSGANEGEGANAGRTIIRWDDGANEILADGRKRGTFRTATLLVDGDSFTARNLTIENGAGSGDVAGQAIALYVDAEDALVENCAILGWQDTLFLAPLPPTEYEPGGFRGPKERTPRRDATCSFVDCRIEGSVDFIFGGARALFEHCDIVSRDIVSRDIVSRDIVSRAEGYVAAPCTPEGASVGFVFRECRFTGKCDPRSVYLARPWRDHAKAAFIKCELGAHIREAGFHDWGKTGARATVDFAEYANTGPGSADGADGTGPGSADEASGRRAPFARELAESEAETLVELARINRSGRS